MSIRYWPKRVCFQTFVIWLVGSIGMAAASETDVVQSMSTGQVVGALVAALVAMTGAMVAVINRWVAKVGSSVPRARATHVEDTSHELREMIRDQLAPVVEGQKNLSEEIKQVRHRIHELSNGMYTLVGKFDMLPCVRGNGVHKEGCF
jgi:hypothetical protein